MNRIALSDQPFCRSRRAAPRQALSAKSPFRFGFVVAGLVSLVFFRSEPLHAAQFIWNDSSSNFNSSSSWILLGGGSGVPGSGDNAIFGSSSFVNNPSFTASTSVGLIRLAGGADALTFSASSGTTLTLGSGGILNESSNALTMNTGNLSLALSGSSSLTGDGTISIGSSIASFSIGSNTLTLNGTGTGSTIATAISGGSGNLVKADTGTWTLSASNSYTGGTTVDGGILKFTAAANASTSLTINSSGTLQVAAANVFSSASTVTLNGGTLQVSGGAFSQSFGTSSSALTGGQLAAISFDGLAAQIDSSGFVTPVPEPATYGLVLGAGVLGFIAYRRRQGATRGVVAR